MPNSIAAYGWIKKGTEKAQKANSGRARLNINGAYNVEENTVIVREEKRIHADLTIALIEQIKAQQREGNIFSLPIMLDIIVPEK